jgi:hypothetical protein
MPTPTLRVKALHDALSGLATVGVEYFWIGSILPALEAASTAIADADAAVSRTTANNQRTSERVAGRIARERAALFALAVASLSATLSVLRAPEPPRQRARSARPSPLRPPRPDENFTFGLQHDAAVVHTEVFGSSDPSPLTAPDLATRLVLLPEPGPPLSANTTGSVGPFTIPSISIVAEAVLDILLGDHKRRRGANNPETYKALRKALYAAHKLSYLHPPYIAGNKITSVPLVADQLDSDLYLKKYNDCVAVWPQACRDLSGLVSSAIGAVSVGRDLSFNPDTLNFPLESFSKNTVFQEMITGKDLPGSRPVCNQLYTNALVKVKTTLKIRAKAGLAGLRLGLAAEHASAHQPHGVGLDRWVSLVGAELKQLGLDLVVQKKKAEAADADADDEDDDDDEEEEEEEGDDDDDDDDGDDDDDDEEEEDDDDDGEEEGEKEDEDVGMATDPAPLLLLDDDGQRRDGQVTDEIYARGVERGARVKAAAKVAAKSIAEVAEVGPLVSMIQRCTGRTSTTTPTASFKKKEASFARLLPALLFLCARLRRDRYVVDKIEVLPPLVKTLPSVRKALAKAREWQAKDVAWIAPRLLDVHGQAIMVNTITPTMFNSKNTSAGVEAAARGLAAAGRARVTTKAEILRQFALTHDDQTVQTKLAAGASVCEVYNYVAHQLLRLANNCVIPTGTVLIDPPAPNARAVGQALVKRLCLRYVRTLPSSRPSTPDERIPTDQLPCVSARLAPGAADLFVGVITGTKPITSLYSQVGTTALFTRAFLNRLSVAGWRELAGHALFGTVDLNEQSLICVSFFSLQHLFSSGRIVHFCTKKFDLSELRALQHFSGSRFEAEYHGADLHPYLRKKERQVSQLHGDRVSSYIRSVSYATGLAGPVLFIGNSKVKNTSQVTRSLSKEFACAFIEDGLTSVACLCGSRNDVVHVKDGRRFNYHTMQCSNPNCSMTTHPAGSTKSPLFDRDVGTGPVQLLLALRTFLGLDVQVNLKHPGNQELSHWARSNREALDAAQ